MEVKKSALGLKDKDNETALHIAVKYKIAYD